MTFKLEKCYLLTITHKINISRFSYTINNVTLASKDSRKYLGVIIDSRLNWNEHCSGIAAKAGQALGLIQRTLHTDLPKCKSITYKALVRPRLEYTSTAWSAHTDKHTRLLEKVQNNAAASSTRSMTGTPVWLHWRKTSTGPLYSSIATPSPHYVVQSSFWWP